MTHTHPPDQTPTRRASDPPHGSVAARWNDALKPWYGLLVAVLAMWSIISTVALSIGFSFSTPASEVAKLRVEMRARNDSLSERIGALERADVESKAQRDRTQALAEALTKSKCLELRGNDEAQALSVLPCHQFFQRWPISDDVRSRVKAETILMAALWRDPLDEPTPVPGGVPVAVPRPFLHAEPWRFAAAFVSDTTPPDL